MTRNGNFMGDGVERKEWFFDLAVAACFRFLPLQAFLPCPRQERQS
jgi:hypothetical protein